MGNVVETILSYVLKKEKRKKIFCKVAEVRFELVMALCIYRRPCIHCATETSMLFNRVFEIINNRAAF